MKIRNATLSSSYEPNIARLFSAAVLKELATKGHSYLAASLLKEADLLQEYNPSTILRFFFDEAYDVLLRKYRNEYVYKNAIAKNILLGRHSLSKTFMLTEFRAGNCKADVVLLNGTSTVYEIKTAYDSMERLSTQIAAYRKVFDNINVITSFSQLAKVEDVIDDDIGIMVLTDSRNSIKIIRKPVSLKEKVQPLVIFDSLRKSEYEQITKEHFDVVLNVSNANMYRTCRECFCSLTPIMAHDYMVTALKKRGSSRRLCDFIKLVPDSLKAASLSCKFNDKQKAFFLEVLDTDIGTCLGVG